MNDAGRESGQYRRVQWVVGLQGLALLRNIGSESPEVADARLEEIEAVLNQRSGPLRELLDTPHFDFGPGCSIFVSR
jgi:hypothetical protein